VTNEEAVALDRQRIRDAMMEASGDQLVGMDGWCELSWREADAIIFDREPEE
jgi:hypothetical protein